ncbi:MAG: hypothetical protein HC907_29755 [Richelia sp. SM1_7_0]|nr:hypothetical protein [Richelia sp. SM1_7_0]
MNKVIHHSIKKLYVEVNDIQDFSMPYKVYGKLDKEIMLDKYNRLTNKPKYYLHERGIW